MERPHRRRDELVSAEETDALAARKELQDEPGGLANRLLERRVPLRPRQGGPGRLELDDDLAPQLGGALLDDRPPLPRGLRPVDVARVVSRDGLPELQDLCPAPLPSGSIPSSTASRASGGGKAAAFGLGKTVRSSLTGWRRPLRKRPIG